jgi:hypothetical protein
MNRLREDQENIVNLIVPASGSRWQKGRSAFFGESGVWILRS